MYRHVCAVLEERQTVANPVMNEGRFTVAQFNVISNNLSVITES